VGRKVGWLQFSNIVGSAIGACWVSLLGFELFGTAVLLKLLVAIGLVYVIVLHWRRRQHVAITAGFGILLGSVVIALPGNNDFWLKLNGMLDGQRFIQEENGSGLSIVKQMDRDGELVGVVFANGLGQSRMPYRTDPTHMRLGAVPVLLHPSPRSVAVVGMGSAGTLYGMACRPETEVLTCFEIMSNQPNVLRTYAERVDDRSVMAMLNDERLTVVGNDGRYELSVRGTRYDIIEADALRPNSAFSGNIYSAEYFKLLRDRLLPGGWAVSWCPTPRTLSTFCSVFSHVAFSEGLLLIGSNDPIVLDWEAVNERIGVPFTLEHFRRAEVDIAAQGYHTNPAYGDHQPIDRRYNEGFAFLVLRRERFADHQQVVVDADQRHHHGKERGEQVAIGDAQHEHAVLGHETGGQRNACERQQHQHGRYGDPRVAAEETAEDADVFITQRRALGQGEHDELAYRSQRIGGQVVEEHIGRAGIATQEGQ